MDENRTLAVTSRVTARETSVKQILLFTPSDEQEGYRVPPNEIYLTYDAIRKLADWVGPSVDKTLVMEDRFPAENVDSKGWVNLEIMNRGDGNFRINVVFLNTGEIRQKIVSGEWLLKRLFQYELKTWKKWDGEDLILNRCVITELM